jgi:glucosamine-phosphate N-acetyltransferase
MRSIDRFRHARERGEQLIKAFYILFYFQFFIYIMDIKFNIRNLGTSDYYKEYFNLLSQLTTAPIISYEQFVEFINGLNLSHQVFVIEDLSTNRIIATGTILIECKLIHELGKVAHIEDIVTDNFYRGQGLGKYIIDKLIGIAQYRNCYKVILDCAEHNIGFYTKCGFEIKGMQMEKKFL